MSVQGALLSVFLTKFRYMSYQAVATYPHEIGRNQFQIPHSQKKKNKGLVRGTYGTVVRHANLYATVAVFTGALSSRVFELSGRRTTILKFHTVAVPPTNKSSSFQS